MESLMNNYHFETFISSETTSVQQWQNNIKYSSGLSTVYIFQQMESNIKLNAVVYCWMKKGAKVFSYFFKLYKTGMLRCPILTEGYLQHLN